MTDIDRLYQLPLAEFTSARNALAKTGGADVRALAKPTVPAWAVNQVYWRDRKTYQALVAAAEAQRRTHHAVLAGKKGDLRAAGRAHEQAVDAALKSAVAILASDGHPVTDATRQGILTTLRALSGDEPAGRLTRTLQPGGFEMLAGLTIAGGGARAAKAPSGRSGDGKSTTPAKATGRREAAKPAAERKALERARKQVAEATAAVRQAEHAARREEFDAARAAREAEKAQRAVDEARAAYEAAREALDEATAALSPAVRARDAASRGAQKARDALASARRALEAAEARAADLEE